MPIGLILLIQQAWGTQAYLLQFLGPPGLKTILTLDFFQSHPRTAFVPQRALYKSEVNCISGSTHAVTHLHIPLPRPAAETVAPAGHCRPCQGLEGAQLGPEPTWREGGGRASTRCTDSNIIAL